MDINATLIGEVIAFAIIIAITMKFIWPPILAAIEERQRKIAEASRPPTGPARNWPTPTAVPMTK